jgi:uncharacterized protein YdaU (DUF1376 family)
VSVNYYKRHLGDYAKKCGHLTPLEHGVYGLVMDGYYDRERAPTRDEAIRWARARSDQEIAAVDSVLGEFFTLQDGRYMQKRIEEELEAFRARQEANRKLGAIGGKAKGKRAASVPLSESVSESVSETLSEREAKTKPSHKPLATSQEKDIPPSAAQSAPEDDPIKAMIDGALAFMAERGVADRQARSMIGMARKRVGDLEACELLGTMQRDQVADPLPWLRRAAERRAASKTPADDRPDWMRGAL